MSETTKGGNIILQSVMAPTVAPGEPFTVEAHVDNKAMGILPWDDDHCDPNAMSMAGYKLFVEFEGPDGQTAKSEPNCHAMALNGNGSNTYSADFTAPDTPGDYEVSARVVMRDSGESTAWMDNSVVVSDSAPREPQDPGENDGNSLWGGNNNNNDNNPIPEFKPLEGLSTIGLVVVLAIGVFIVMELSDSAPTPARVIQS